MLFSAQSFFSAVGGDFEQLRPGLAVRMAGDLQVRLQAQEAAVAASICVGEDRADVAVAFAGRDDAAVGEQASLMWM